MTIARLLFASSTLFVALSAAPNAVRAAQSYDNCNNFIDTLPATISTQGVWCLRHDLSTNIASGNAITINANNVTIDCNDFKVGGLAAGASSSAIGIHAGDRQNATVRHCNVRGFNTGIELNGGAGHLVEDNRLDNNLYYGISVTGDNNRVRRNAVYDTGGRSSGTYAYGIYAYADIVDNTVSGLFVDASGGFIYGIIAYGAGAQVRDNKVSGLNSDAAQGGTVNMAFGITMTSSMARASGNQVVGSGATNGIGINVNLSTDYCLDNTVGGFTNNIDGSCISNGNLTPP